MHYHQLLNAHPINAHYYEANVIILSPTKAIQLPPHAEDKFVRSVQGTSRADHKTASGFVKQMAETLVDHPYDHSRTFRKNHYQSALRFSFIVHARNHVIQDRSISFTTARMREKLNYNEANKLLASGQATRELVLLRDFAAHHHGGSLSVTKKIAGAKSEQTCQSLMLLARNLASDTAFCIPELDLIHNLKNTKEARNLPFYAATNQTLDANALQENWTAQTTHTRSLAGALNIMLVSHLCQEEELMLQPQTITALGQMLDRDRKKGGLLNHPYGR